MQKLQALLVLTGVAIILLFVIFTITNQNSVLLLLVCIGLFMLLIEIVVERRITAKEESEFITFQDLRLKARDLHEGESVFVSIRIADLPIPEQHLGYLLALFGCSISPLTTVGRNHSGRKFEIHKLSFTEAQDCAVEVVSLS